MRLLDRYTKPQLARLIERASPEQREAILPAIEAELFEEDPALWGKLKLKEFWWSKQREIAESVRDNRLTAVHSANGVGKSFLAARVICWWLDTHPPGEAFAITTAPTEPQVKAILWRYINDAHKKGQLIGRVNQKEWLIGDQLIGIGRKPADTAEGGPQNTTTAFQGMRGKYTLVVLDEAAGIPETLWVAAGSLITGRHGRMLAIGNPDDPTSRFEFVCRPESGWNVLGISAFDTPFFTGEPVPDGLLAELPDDVWVAEQERAYGVGTAVYTAKVLGQFPLDASDAVIPYSFAAPCRYLNFDLHPDHFPTLGVDVGAGGDETVITAFQDRKFVALPERVNKQPHDSSQWRSRHDDPMLCVSEVMDAIRVTKAKRVNIDAIGVGWAVAGAVDEKCKMGNLKVEVNAVKVSEQSSDPDKYANLRAELWWNARLALHEKQWDIGVLDDKCMADLTTPKYTDNADTHGKIQIEKNELITQRLKRSPDSGSSALLAAHIPVRPQPITGGRVQDRRLSRRR